MSQPCHVFLGLSIAERIQLMEDIWDSIAAESPESMALTFDQVQAVQQVASSPGKAAGRTRESGEYGDCSPG